MAGRGGIRSDLVSTLSSGGSVVLVGPAGVGKTTLATELCRHRSTAVGQCLPSLRDHIYRPLVHAVKRPLNGPPDVVSVEVASALDGRWLVIEDVHWADAPTMAALGELVDRVTVLVTTRGPDPFGDRITRHDVQPLSRRSALALVRRQRPELDPTEVGRLVDLAGGNPLLLRELGAGTDLTVSPTLDEAIRSRVAALPDEERSALRLLALHGRPAPPALIGHRGTTGLGGLVDEEDGLVWFGHDLLRAAVDDSITPEERVGLHAVLAERSDDADAADHLLAAGRPDLAAEAAERAAAGASVTERARLLLLSVTAGGDAASDDVRLAAADALVASHRSEDAERVAADVRSEDPITRATAGWLRSRAAWMQGDAGRANELLDEALRPVEGSGTRIEAHLRVERANIRIRERPGDPSLGEEIEQALAMAELTGVELARAHSLRGRSLAHSFRRGWDEHYRTAQRIARVDGDHDQECAAMYWLLSAEGFFGPLSDALGTGRSLVARAKEVDQLGWYHQALAAYGLHAVAAGVLEPELRRELERLLDHDPDFRNRAHVRFVLAQDLIDRSDLGGAAAVIDIGRSEARTGDEAALMSIARAELADAAGDPDLMLTALLELIDCGAGFFGMKVLAEASATHLFLHDPDAPAIPRFSDLCPPIMAGVAAERAAYDAVRSGDLAGALTRLEAVAGHYLSEGAPRPAARSLHGAMVTAERLGRTGQAQRLRERCRDLCDQHGFGSLAARVRDAQVRAGARASRELLSPRELTVLELVGTGATSAEIAAALGIGRATVDSHVDSARRKLGATTRRQAAAMLAGPLAFPWSRWCPDGPRNGPGRTGPPSS